MDARYPDQRALRVSDPEREHVVTLLQRATGLGLIDLDEFIVRVDRALASTTRGELNAVLVDLPGLVHSERGHPARHPDAAARLPGPAPTTRSTAVPDGAGVELRTSLSSITRRGQWEVPARLAVRSVLGSTDLDFTEAAVPHPVVTVELDVVAGSVELRVPEGCRVDHDRVDLLLSSLTDHRRGSPTGTGPRFVLIGTVRAGSVEVRPPRRRWWRPGG